MDKLRVTSLVSLTLCENSRDFKAILACSGSVTVTFDLVLALMVVGALIFRVTNTLLDEEWEFDDSRNGLRLKLRGRYDYLGYAPQDRCSF